MTEQCVGVTIKPVRVFFAIFPNKRIQEQLVHLAESLEPICGGRKIKKQRIHLTLLFLGNINAHRIEALQQAMKMVTEKEFELSLEEICQWKKNQIIYVQSNKFPAELFSLVDSIGHVLSEIGFLLDNHTYKPHITLLRKAVRPAKIGLIEPIQWRVNEWFLIQSKQTDHGVDYIPLGQWRLK